MPLPCSAGEDTEFYVMTNSPYRNGSVLEIVAVGVSKWRAHSENVWHYPEGVGFVVASTAKRMFLPWHSVARIQEADQ
jgi:hypothetical protein